MRSDQTSFIISGFGAFLLFLLVSCDRQEPRLDFIRGEQIKLGSELPEDPDIIEQTAPYRRQLQSFINTPLAYNPRLLTKKEAPLESSLGNLVADIALKTADSILRSVKGSGVDLALLNFGGLRISLDPGMITVEDIFKLMPFENKLVIARLSPENIGLLLDYLATEKKAHPISGIQLILDQDEIQQVTIDGRPLDPERAYYVVTSDYLQNGGDNMTFFKDPVYLYRTDLKIRDMLIGSFSKTDTLKAPLDGRFKQLIPVP